MRRTIIYTSIEVTDNLTAFKKLIAYITFIVKSNKIQPGTFEIENCIGFMYP